MMEAAQTPRADAPVQTVHSVGPEPELKHGEEILAKVGEAGHVELVPLDQLQIDPSYQRDLTRDLVERIKANWDAAAAGPIVVSRRASGDLYIVNGQHRAAAAAELGKVELLAQVIPGLTREQEAELRLMGNTRRTDSPQERFRAQVAAGHPESLEIVRIVSQFGTRINPSPNTKQGINSVSAVEKLYRIDQGRLLTRTLETVHDAFGSVDGPHASVALLNAIAWTLHKHSYDEIDRRRLLERLNTSGLDALMRSARNYKAAVGGALWMNVYRALVEVYNHRLGEGSRMEVKTGGWTTGGMQLGYDD